MLVSIVTMDPEDGKMLVHVLAAVLLAKIVFFLILFSDPFEKERK